MGSCDNELALWLHEDHFVLYTVVDHAVEEPAKSSSTSADRDATEMCRFAPTSMCFISPSTSCQPVLATVPSNFTMVQQDNVSGVSGDDCNVAAIVVPIVVVIIASTVSICIVIFMAVRWKKTSGLDLSTTKKDEIICVVKNDLYELVRCIYYFQVYYIMSFYYWHVAN